MSFAKLYTYENNPRARVALIAANYEGVQLEIVPTNPFEGVSAEYKEKFPMGKVPTLEQADGFKLFEVIAVAEYVACANGDKASLTGKTTQDKVTVLQWASWANSHLLPALGSWFAPLIGRTPYNKQNVETAKTTVYSLLDFLEKSLVPRTFLVGDRITLADIFIASFLVRGFEFVLDAEYRAAHPTLLRYFNTIAHQPQFLSVLGGEPKFIEKTLVYTPPKKEEKPKAAKAPAAAAPKAAPKPKAKEVNEDEDEDVTPAEPKAKHPAEALGPAKSFALDEWKRQYSNNDTPVAMKWLQEHYNSEDYTFWKATYKYPEELTQVYMSSNLVGGFHSRLEASRKYLFGSAGVYGENNKSKIVGVYMIRGSDPTSIFDVAPDFESYEITPLDFSTDREFIGGCWEWTNEVDGLKYADGKVFK